MFIEAWCTITKIWKKLVYNRRKNKENVIYMCMCVCVCVYVCECVCDVYVILFSHKNEIMPFVTAWMDLQGMVLSEVSQTKKTIWSHLYMGPKNSTELTDTETRLVIARGIGWRHGWKVQVLGYKISKAWGKVMYSIVTIATFTGLYIWKMLKE